MLNTERLFLREWQSADADFLYALHDDFEVMYRTGDDPFPHVDAARDFIQNYGAYAQNGFGRWAVGLRETGELIGWCGLERDENGVNLDCRLAQAFWNNGYATEAAKACCDWGLGVLELDNIVAYVHPESPAALRVAEKLGFVFSTHWNAKGIWWSGLRLYRAKA